MSVYLFYFFPGGLYQNNSPRRSGEGAFDRRLKALEAFLGDQKVWGVTGPPHTPIFSPKLSEKILRWPFCSV